MLFSFLFRFEDKQDHHDEEEGDGHAQQDAQQHLAHEPETERLEEKQRKVMDEHHEKGISQKPDAVQLSQVGFLDVFKLLVARDESDDGRPAESHQGGGSGMKPWRSREQVDGQAQRKAQHQQLPFRCVKRQQHDENQVNIRMDIAAQTDVVDDQHLEEHEHHETDDL